MTSEPAEPPPEQSPDAAHLDEDAEALEDPVHAGDARHQHERHADDDEPRPDSVE